ncbi:MFS transporter [Streptomyces tricolor]|nr:MFS transporter [Streptomyces tricolor]
MTTLPLYLQLVRGMSPIAAGAATLPTVLANLAVTLVVGRLIARTGRFKVHLVAGCGSLAAAMLVFATLGVDSPLWQAALGMALMGAGLGAAMQTLTTLAQCEVPREDMGAATASVNFFRSNGGTVGTAAFLSVLFSTAAGRIADRLAEARQDAAYRRLLAEPGNAHALTGVLRPGGVSAFRTRPSCRRSTGARRCRSSRGTSPRCAWSSSPGPRCRWWPSWSRPGGCRTSRSATTRAFPSDHPTVG